MPQLPAHSDHAPQPPSQSMHAPARSFEVAPLGTCFMPAGHVNVIKAHAATSSFEQIGPLYVPAGHGAHTLHVPHEAPPVEAHGPRDVWYCPDAHPLHPWYDGQLFWSSYLSEHTLPLPPQHGCIIPAPYVGAWVGGGSVGAAVGSLVGGGGATVGFFVGDGAG